MKIFNSLILLLFFNTAFAQRTPFNDVVNISLPKESIKVTVNQLDSLITNNDEYLTKIKGRVFMNADSYLIGTMLLQIKWFYR